MNELLIPLSTMFTGACAVVAVLVNNYYVSKNLTRKIEAESEENKLRDKQFKLEQLFEALSAFYEDTTHYLVKTSDICWNEEYSYTKKHELLQLVLNDYSKSQSSCRKAQILGYSYSDSNDLCAAIDVLKEHDKQTKISIQTLASMYHLANLLLDPDESIEATEKENMDNLRESISSMINNIDGIEQLIIKELRECRVSA